jgi:hypothetical protein
MITGVEIIDGTSVRLRWDNKIEPEQRGLWGCRLLTAGAIRNVGLCVVDESLDQCEMMIFALASSPNDRLLTSQDVESLFPVGRTWELLFVHKTSQFATIAFGAWLHDHIQRNLDALGRWGVGKALSPGVRASLHSLL